MSVKKENKISGFHPFSTPVTHIVLPPKFTCPFHYTPHPLCIIASEEIQDYLSRQKQWEEELNKGKMFGVLVVRTETGRIGYLAAFSGILAGRNIHPYFVPPVYDLQQPQGFFKKEEANITALNERINTLENDTHYLNIRQKISDINQKAGQILADAKDNLKKAKADRDVRRKNPLTETEQADLLKESQFRKAEFRRLKQYWEKQIDAIQSETDRFTLQIETLKEERKNRSAALQQKLFEQFQLLNARGEIRNLCDIFKETVHKTPPAGAGECAAPKLLQYAYLNRLHPIAMAEFWWGNSPKTELRRHGYYYPACKGKCEPILKHMLQGLDVEDNLLPENTPDRYELEILYEDQWLLIVNKPAGMLSVPGKSSQASVCQLLQKHHPALTGLTTVHRLDMATSGLLLIAKTKDIHYHLQRQFKNRTIKKSYVAILDGNIDSDEGIIELPLCLDPWDRPRQIVSPEHGKPSVTRYRVVEHNANRTRIVFYPLTGRTHQLRVHAAHPLGLNTPILGDTLYGREAERLYLHAESLEFRHPVSHEIIRIEKKAEF